MSEIRKQKVTMTYSISPIHTTDDFKGHWTLADKIEVFVARVEGWHLGVAKEIIKRDIPSRDLARLHIVTSFFEMISYYTSGIVRERKSKEHFQRGVRLIFPEIKPEAKAFLDSLYKYVRNGLYHIGRPAPNVIIAKDLPVSVGYNSQDDLIMVNPDQLVEDVLIAFAAYARDLRNPENKQLRSNFEKRFDSDNRLARTTGRH
jgi:hypothetical protein